MPAVTLVLGDEDLLVARAVARALEAVQSAAGGSIEVHDVLAVEITVDDLAEMTSPSLFGDPRAIVIRAVQDAAKGVADAVVRLAEDSTLDAALVVVHNGGVKGKAFVKALEGAGARTVPAPRVKNVRDREQFVADEVKAAGGKIDKDAAVDLVASIGADLRELSTACLQLVTDVGPRITAEHVAAYYRGRAESTGFAVADRAVEGDLPGALETLRWAFATGVDPVLVSAALAANLRTIALVGAAGRGSPDSLSGPLGMPAWKIRRAQTWVKRWKPDALADAVQAVAAADAGIKGAGDDAAFAAERAVIAVAAGVAG